MHSHLCTHLALTFGAHVRAFPSRARTCNTFFPEGDVLRVRASRRGNKSVVRTEGEWRPLRLHVRAQRRCYKSRPLRGTICTQPKGMTCNRFVRRFVGALRARTCNRFCATYTGAHVRPSPSRARTCNTFGGARTWLPRRGSKHNRSSKVLRVRARARFVRNEGDDRCCNASLTQLVEYLFCKQNVSGSSPLGGRQSKKRLFRNICSS